MALGIPISTYSAHERAESPGGRDYGPEEAQQYARRFGVTPEWLLTGHRQTADDSADASSTDVSERPKRSTTTKLRIYGYVGTGAQSYFYGVAPEYLDQIQAPRFATESTVALEIRGKSMGSQFDHWFLLYDNVRRRPTADLIGEVCVVALEDGRVLVKQLQRGRIEGRFDLISQVGPTIHNVGIVWAANVTGMIQP
jgi:hypothetical protein